jgi:cobalt/nickel transport system permease protein
LELALRILGGMSVLLCFSMTTPLTELLRAARFFRCPTLLVELTMMIYRYLFLLLEEVQRIRNAQAARLGYARFRRGLASSATLGGMLILRTYDRAERNMLAMRSRGYQGVMPGETCGRMAGRDWLVLGVGSALLLSLYLLR